MIRHKKAFGVVLVLFSVAGLGAFTLLMQPQSESVAEEPLIKYDDECMRKDTENEVLLDEAHGGKRYKYVFSKKKDPSGFVRLLYTAIEADNVGCEVLRGERYFRELPTEELRNKFVLAYWRSQVPTAQQKKNLEKFIASTPIGIMTSNSLQLFQRDLDALDQLGIAYPKYVKALDSFETPMEAEEYYSKIFNQEWFEAHPEAGVE